MDQLKVFLNKIAFVTKLEKVKHEGIKSYLKDFFCYKNLFFKAIGIVFCLIVCAPLFFCIRENVLNSVTAKPEFNLGAGFSAGDNWNQGVVYTIKVIIGLLFLLIGIFSNRWYIYLPSLVVGFNGWYNVIDKCMVDVYNGTCHYNTVVDYIYLATGSSFASIANVADVFITIGICFLVLGIIYYFIVLAKEEKKIEQEPKDDTKVTETTSN